MAAETGLHPVTSKRLRDEWEALRRNQIVPWAFFNTGRMRVRNFYGEQISVSGIKFEGSARELFWGRYIEPFLEEIVLRTLDQTLQLCKDEGHEPKPALVETARLLKRLIQKAYQEMADVDRRLRGDGYPERVSGRDITTEVATMEEFVDKRVSGLLAVARPSRTRLRDWQDYLANHRLIAGVILCGTVIVGLAAVKGSLSSLVAPFVPSPSIEILQFHPVFLWRPFIDRIGGEEVRRAERGVAAIVRIRSGGDPISVSGIQYDAALRLSIEEWLGFFGKEGASLDDEESKFVRTQAFQSVSFAGWLADSATPVRLEPHEERYLRFILVSPSADAQPLLLDMSYIGSAEHPHVAATRRHLPRTRDFVTPKPHPDGWMARDLRDEVRSGAARFSLIAGGKNVIVGRDVIRPIVIVGVNDWKQKPAEALLSGYP